MRILVVEDDPILGKGLSSSLGDSAYAVDWARDGEKADFLLSQTGYDAIILDLGLPKLDGLEVLRRLRRRNKRTPVIILTARDDVEDRVAGLDLGADDYLTKPFDLSELEARLRALIRRSHDGAEGVMEFGNLHYDMNGQRVYIDGKPVDLSAREIGVFQILALHAGRVVSKEKLLDHLCGYGEEVFLNAVEVYVHRLRKKLESSRVVIRTIRGLGYLLEKPHDS
ncbi:MAG TPA: response regulator transcription factor [Candidatus Methylomirabilis sp.]|nr:response regulator transcription factor [Candidatus Methylomirabilis sp.]